MMDPYSPPGHASISLKAILLTFALILVGILTYLVWDYQNTPDANDYSTTSATNAGIPTEVVDETVGWKTYINSDYSVSFRYPPTWAIESENKNRFDNESPSFTETHIVFITDRKDKYHGSDDTYTVTANAHITNYDAYFEIDQSTPSESYTETLTDLRSVFTNQTVSLKQGEFFPRTNWGIFASGVPAYINTPDNAWRGYYFFGTVGQDYNQAITSIFNMTDGKSVVIGFRVSLLSEKAESDPCTTQECVNDFYSYVQTITDDKKTEPAVEYFNTVIKMIAQSVKST